MLSTTDRHPHPPIKRHSFPVGNWLVTFIKPIPLVIILVKSQGIADRKPLLEKINFNMTLQGRNITPCACRPAFSFHDICSVYISPTWPAHLPNRNKKHHRLAYREAVHSCASDAGCRVQSPVVFSLRATSASASPERLQLPEEVAGFHVAAPV